MLHFVYALVDPRSNTPGYVGLTNNPNQRLCEHLEGRVGKGKKHEWINQLIAERATPKMNILEVIDGSREEARKRERYWVQFYIAQGIQLTNAHLIAPQKPKPQPKNKIARPLTVKAARLKPREQPKIPTTNPTQSTQITTRHPSQSIYTQLRERTYTLKEVMAILHLSRNQVYKLADERAINAVHPLFISQTFYPKYSVDAYARKLAKAREQQQAEQEEME